MHGAKVRQGWSKWEARERGVKEAAATPRALVRDLAIIPASLTVEAPPTASAKTTTYTIEEFEKRKQTREPMSSVRRSARTPKRNGH